MLSYSQNVTVRPNPNKLKVTLTKDALSVMYNNQRIPVGSVQALDSFMRKMPDFKQLEVEFESMNADAGKTKSINAVLKQCNCPTARKSSVFNEH